jgi:N,N-dimethylformamidase
MRPKLRYWILDASRHFPADLYLIDWLETKGFVYDVATDHDLHAEGRELLSRYRVVLTGSHPEYWTAPMLDALEGYLDGGGRLMYLGGNGFYWVTGIDPERPHLFEVRRGHAGVRAWESRPGETYLASTGEPGGLWRYRGRAPNRLVGVGFTAQGWDLKTPGYARLPESFAERARFIFEGVAPDEIIGDFGLVMNGAAGDEIDRVDRDLGTPPHALRLATSQGRHSDYYMLAVEEIPIPTNRVHGRDNPLIRADMVYFETPNGGAVFSVGSMSWSGSLSHNRYDNNVSRVTENVLRRFLS